MFMGLCKSLSGKGIPEHITRLQTGRRTSDYPISPARPWRLVQDKKFSAAGEPIPRDRDMCPAVRAWPNVR